MAFIEPMHGNKPNITYLLHKNYIKKKKIDSFFDTLTLSNQAFMCLLRG